MLALAITDLGLEEITALEVKEQLQVDSKLQNTVVVFKTSKDQIRKFAENSRSVKRVLHFIADFSFKDSKDLLKKASKLLKNFDFEEYFDKNKSFKVVCKKINNNISSSEIQEEIGGFVIEKVKDFGFTPKVKMKDPDVIVFCYVYKNKCYLGIDVLKKDLSKREYKIYSTQNSIKGNLAYSLVRISGYEKNKTLLDPFCGSGVIPIEAALFEQGKIHGTDNFSKNVKYAKGNAHIAGVEIDLSKTNVDFLDTKFDESSVDCIVTYPPQVSKRSKPKQIEKIYDEFLYQCKYILSENGCLVVLMTSKDLFIKIAEKHGFKISEETKIVTGEMEYYVLKAKT